MTLTRLAYIDACASAISAPHTNTVHVSLMTRITQEWGNASDHGPTYNALDLTQIEAGCSPYNSFGPGGGYHVWNYPNLATGAKAFHDIMQAPEYAEVLKLLQQGTVLADIVIDAWNRTNWGYCNPALVSQTRNNFPYYASLLVKE